METLDCLKKLIGRDIKNVDFDEIMECFVEGDEFEDLEYEPNLYFKKSENNGYDFIAYLDYADSTNYCFETDENGLIVDVWDE